MNISPYDNAALNKIYNMLFCDDIELYRNSSVANPVYPWDVLFSEDLNTAELLKVATDEHMETRIQLLAYNLLQTSAKIFLGIIVEVGMEDGLDTLAAYKDGTARYINHAESMIVWDTVTSDSQQLIDDLFYHSFEVVKKIGPWDKERLPPPGAGEIRLSFLVSDGLYFGNGPFAVLEKDAMAGPVIKAATDLLVFLTRQKQPATTVQ